MVNLCFWKAGRVAPPKVPTDTVIPLHSFDDKPINKGIVLLFMMRFDDVLDPEKLRSSLEKLLDREGWRKLGARLRLNSKGKLEYHIPASFDREARPLIAYSHVRYDVAIGEHPLASRLPRAEKNSGKPTVLCDLEEFRELMRRPDGPTTLDDYLYGDEPQLGLHVVSFADATLVSINWPHTLLDGMGRRVLLEAWVAVLEGREEDLLPFYGYDHDPLADIGLTQKPGAEPYKLAGHLLNTWQVVIYGIRYMWDLFRYRSEGRMVFMPASWLVFKSITSSPFPRCWVLFSPSGSFARTLSFARTILTLFFILRTLFENTRADFSSNGVLEAQNGNKPAPSFISEGDILSAYLVRLATQHLPRNSTRTVSVMNALGLRGSLIPPDQAYVANAVWGVFSLLTLRDVLTRPLSVAAGVFRRSIAELGAREQLEARAAFLRARGPDKLSSMLEIYGDTGMLMITISNWSKGRFFETDFSAAIVDGGGSGGGGGGRKPSNYKRGRPSYIQPYTFFKGFSPRNAFPIIGKDAEGNYWWTGTLRKGLWAGVEETFKADWAAMGV